MNDELDKKKIFELLQRFSEISHGQHLSCVMSALAYLWEKIYKKCFKNKISIEQFAEEVKDMIITASKDLDEEEASEEDNG